MVGTLCVWKGEGASDGHWVHHCRPQKKPKRNAALGHTGVLLEALQWGGGVKGTVEIWVQHKPPLSQGEDATQMLSGALWEKHPGSAPGTPAAGGAPLALQPAPPPSQEEVLSPLAQETVQPQWRSTSSRPPRRGCHCWDPPAGEARRGRVGEGQGWCPPSGTHAAPPHAGGGWRCPTTQRELPRPSRGPAGY